MTRPHPAEPERGSIAAFTVISLAALLLVVGLVYDGGLVLAAQRRAVHTAEAAARAGAQAIDEPTLRATGTLQVDGAEATRLAGAYLATTDTTGTVEVTAPDEVSVTVTVTQPLALLGLVGLQTRTVTGQASARAVQGIQEPPA